MPTIVADASSCLAVSKSSRGTVCGNSKSFEIQMKNSCGKTPVADLCVYSLATNRFSCGANLNMQPGDTVYTYQCESGGRYKFAGCTKPSGAYNGRCSSGE